MNNKLQRFLFLARSNQLLTDSIIHTFVIIGVVETLMSVSLLSLERVDKWWVRLMLIVGAYFVILLFIVCFKASRLKDCVTIKIRGMSVVIKQGDLFNSDGWKVISFTDRYDTKVDNRIIAENSINGIFIKTIVQPENNMPKLRRIIASNADEVATPFPRNGDGTYPLGRIKLYEGKYMLLSFIHIDKNNNEVHTTRAEFEMCLRNMWKEINRTYANIPVVLPLLGSGITRFDDWPEKSNRELLACMLCTLRTGSEQFNKKITIVLTEEVMREINLYDLTREYQNGVQR